MKRFDYACDIKIFIPEYKSLLKIVAFLLLIFPLQSIANSKHSDIGVGLFNNNKIIDPIRGTVKNEKGEPLEGVSVSIKGATKGTITNGLGEYSIEAAPNDILVFTYIGHESKEVSSPMANGVTIILAQSQETAADSVVVVGYGTQKKISVVGAITTVPMRMVMQTSTPNLSTAIAGKLPGIISRQSSGEPGYDQTQLYVRGLATFGGQNQSPLVLVDGIERDMNSINAQEVESITILKDASATAVFGVRGANGVILIITKSGKIGKPQVTLRSEYAQLTGMRFSEYINGGDYASLINENRANEAMIDPSRKPKFTQEQIKKYYDQSDPYLYPSVNWTDAVLNKSTYQTINNLSVNGGNNTLRYFLNLGYTRQDGLWKTDPKYKYSTNSTVNRYNLRSKVDVNITDELIADVSLGLIYSQNHHPGYSTGDIFNALSYISPIDMPIYNPDGTLGGAAIVNLTTNPWRMVSNSGYIVYNNYSTQGTLGLKWDLSKKITQGLSLSGRFAYDHNGSGNSQRFISGQIKQYLGKDESGEDQYRVLKEAQNMQYSTSSWAYRSFYAESAVNYDRAFKKHNVTAMIMGNLKDGVDILSGSSIGNIPSRRVGVAGRSTYNYDSRYLLELNAGYNGSENFLRGKRFGFFPSISGGWIVSNEKFWNIKPISLFKIRGSYGVVGNDLTGSNTRFLFLTTMATQNTNFYTFGSAQTIISGIEEGQIGNPDVTWERAKKTNIGFDMQLFNNSLTWQVDAFEENRNHILLTRNGSIPYVSGFLPYILPFANLGKTYNHGIESLIEFKQTTRLGILYSLRGNFTFAKDRLVEIDEAPIPYPYQSLKGQPISISVGYLANGLFKDWDDIDRSPKQKFVTNVAPGDVKYVDINGDGVIDDHDRIPLGYPKVPQIAYGFGGTIGYKGFDLSAYFTGAARVSYFYYGASVWPFMAGEGAYNVLKEFYDNRWVPGADNTNAIYPAVRYTSSLNNYQISSLYMKNGAYLRLKTAEIGYNFSDRILNRININKIRLFINGTNLITWDHLKIVDPELNNGNGWYPLQRVINGGFQVTF